MGTIKRVNGDYTITTVSSDDNVFISTHTVTINGNLDVVGNVTYIETHDLIVDDPFITVAGNNTGTLANALFQEQGLVTQTSSNTYAGLRFNNATTAWEISSNVYANGAPISSYSTIGNGAPPGGDLYTIQYHAPGNVFGGLAGYYVDIGNLAVFLQAQQVFGNIDPAVPLAVANSVSLYHNAPAGSGGTGLYFKSPTQQDELVSKTKAIVFAIIF